MHHSDDPQDQNTDYTSWIAFGIMTVCLSLSFVFVKLSLEAFTLEQAAGGRLVLGAAFLLPITYFLVTACHSNSSFVNVHLFW